MRGNKKTGEFYLHIPTLKQEPDKRGVWCDVVEAVVHANFALLVEFVEKEECFEAVSWDWNEDVTHAGKEIKRLYHWWKVIRPRREKNLPVHWDSCKTPDFNFKKAKHPDYVEGVFDYSKCSKKSWDWACKETQRLDAVWFEEDNQAVKDLMNIRGYLWT